MSLFKQLWLAMAGLLIVVLGATLVAGGLLANQRLEQRFYKENLEESTVLSQLLAQTWEVPQLRDDTLGKEFNSGQCQLLELLDAKGNTLYLNQRSPATYGTPAWFRQILGVEERTGVVPVERHGERLGTLRLRNSNARAYRELWDEFRLLLAVFSGALLLAGLFGYLLLKRILRPLDDIVGQAIAISERRFTPIKEPKTPEFKHLAAAMNTLSDRVRDMFTRETKQLEKLRAQAHTDPVSGLANREPFLRSLESMLKRDDINAAGTLTIVRIGNLTRLNQIYGRRNIDSVIKEIGQALNAITISHADWSAARLSGSDFAVVAPRAVDPMQVALPVQQAIKQIIMGRAMTEHATVPGATTAYVAGDSQSEVLARVDAALLTADTDGESELVLAQRNNVQMLPMREQMEHWRRVLSEATNRDLISLQTYPVLDMEGRLIHYEALARLRWQNETLTAGTFLPWVNRLELSSTFDQIVIVQALELAERHRAPISINLSSASVADDDFLSWLSKRLSTRRELSHRLWFEVTERTAFGNLPRFRKVCEHLRGFGCKIGIEHVGQQLAQLGKLHDLGLHYLKVDAAYVREIDTNPGNQTLVKTLCSAAHSIGLKVIGLGVETRMEMQALDRAEVDGITGPLVTRQLRK